jgi:hypothetical protein
MSAPLSDGGGTSAEILLEAVFCQLGGVLRFEAQLSG